MANEIGTIVVDLARREAAVVQPTYRKAVQPEPIKGTFFKRGDPKPVVVEK